ncbi:hypothetical protein IB276_17835 [Ensifer sp. ENS04]|nr:hypothetical protein [Ensifer sp. ENS04]
MLRNLGIRHEISLPLPRNAPPSYRTIYSTVLSDGRTVSGEGFEGLTEALRAIHDDILREISVAHGDEQRQLLQAMHDEIETLLNDYMQDKRQAASNLEALQRRALTWIPE